MSCPNPYAEILTPKLIVLGGGAFGWWFRHEGGPRNVISTLIKAILESSLVLFLTCEKTSLQAGRNKLL